VWTPKRIIVLAGGFVAFFCLYAAYASTYVGRMDGLPPLPEMYWPNPDQTEIQSVAHGEPVIVSKLKKAFGINCEELKRAIRLELHSKNMVLAAERFDIDSDGRVCLHPISVAVFGKGRWDAPDVEISTVQSEVAYLKFDGPVRNMTELSGRKIVAAELQNNINVTNNRRRPKKDENLYLHINHGPVYYTEKDHTIRTNDAIVLKDHKSKPLPNIIRGKGMEMELLAEAPPHQAGFSSRKARGETITGVKRIVLHRDADMDLYMDGKSGFLSTGAKPADPAAKAPAEKSHVVIRTPGRFQYDLFKDHDQARFDIPKPAVLQPAKSPQHVTVVRYHADGKTDMLVCEHLNLQLRRKNKQATGLAPAPGSTSSGDAALDIETAHATARENDVVLTSDQEKMNAHCNDFFYDAPRQFTVLKGDPEMLAEKDGSIIHALEMYIQEVKPSAPSNAKGYQQITAKGPGTIDMLDKDTKRKSVRAKWLDTLISTKDGQDDLLVLTGDAVFVDDDHDQSLRADVLKVWLGAPEEKKANPAPSTGPVPGGRKPKHVDAAGKVTARSRDLNVHDTSKLVVWFKDVPEDATLPAKVPFKSSVVPAPASAKEPLIPLGQPKATAGAFAQPLPVGPAGASGSKDGKHEGPSLFGPEAGKTEAEKVRPIDLSARSVTAHVLRSPVKNTLKELVAEGLVHVRQEPAKPDEKATDITGDTLTMTYQPQGNLLVVSCDAAAGNRDADLAQLQMDKILIWGPEINIDQALNKAWVHGPGAMKMDSATDFQGAPLKKSVPLTVYWKKSMYFDGRKAEFQGDIQAEQQNARLACNFLQVEFDRPISLKQGQGAKSDQPAKVSNLLCDKNVRIEDTVFNEKKRTEIDKYQILKAKSVEMEALDPEPGVKPVPAPGKPGPAPQGNKVYASGPGSVQIVQRGGADPLAPPPAAPKNPKQPAAPAANANELKLTYVMFGHGMNANSRNGTAKFFENVRVLNMPVTQKTYNQPVNLEEILAKKDLPEGAMYLTCQHLVVLDRPENGQPNQQMHASGGVLVQSREFYATADVVDYNQAKNQVIFRGLEGREAILNKRKARGGEYESIAGQEIIYNKVTGQTEVGGSSSINGEANPGSNSAPRPAAPARPASPPRPKS
jgi:lipopolysaccharide export system protein LptA